MIRAFTEIIDLLIELPLDIVFLFNLQVLVLDGQLKSIESIIFPDNSNPRLFFTNHHHIL